MSVFFLQTWYDPQMSIIGDEILSGSKLTTFILANILTLSVRGLSLYVRILRL